MGKNDNKGKPSYQGSNVITDEQIKTEIEKIKAETFRNNEEAFQKAMRKNNFNMEKLKSILNENILQYLDYLTLFQLKYTNQYIYNEVKRRNIDKTLDLRNTKYQSIL